MKFLWCCLVLLMPTPLFADNSIRYVALGDSYTIGTGALPSQSWPAVLTDRLIQKDQLVELVANLGQPGWTSQNVLEQQVPKINDLNPDVVTLLVGTNDMVRGISLETFSNNLAAILDALLKHVPDRRRILIVTLPDFSLTPAGRYYFNGKDAASQLRKFNAIIRKQARARRIPVFDLFPKSQRMGRDASLISDDGLHPSARGYALWASWIEPSFPKVRKR